MQLPQRLPVAGLDSHAPTIRTPPPEFDAPPGTILAGVWPQPVEPSIGIGMGAQPSENRLELVESPPAPLESPAAASLTANFSERLAQVGIGAEVRQLHVELAYARSEIERLRSEV